jgi:hypothetical protein
MRIEYRLGIITALCYVIGLLIISYISFVLEFRKVQSEVNERSRVLLETALALRSYTGSEVAPLAEKLGYDQFYPQMVPSYGAQTTLRMLRKTFPDYRYREASLNPTNIEDRANDWEVGLLQAFQQDPNLNELSGEVSVGGVPRFFLARPIRMTSTDCLRCHSTPDAAPASMVAKYGLNGFGWKMGEIVGIQLVQVPVSGLTMQAVKGFLLTVGALTCVFVLSFAIFMLLLRRYVTRPLEKITRKTVSTSLDADWHEGGSSTQFGGQFHDLERSIDRLRTSLKEALELFPKLASRKKKP